MRMTVEFHIAAALLCLIPSSHGEQPWSRFRGPNGEGRSQSATFPAQWDERNVLWKIEPMGEGVSSASIRNDRFVVTSANDDGTLRYVECRRLADGKLDWSYQTPFDTNPKHAKNRFAAATPTCEADGVYALFGSASRYVVLALDWTGQLRWQQDLGPFDSRHGCGASPILVDQFLVATQEQDGPSSVVALHRATGLVAWRVPRSATLAAYSTPAVVESEAGSQILVTSTAGMTALDPQTGATLWTESCFPDRCVGSPVIAGHLAIASCGGGGRGTRLVAVRTDAELAAGTSRIVWQETKTIPYCPTPLVVGDLLFFVTDQGIARCLKVSTGQELWTERVLSNTTSSAILVDDKVVAVAEDGNVVVLHAGPQPKILARNMLDDEFYSTPAMAGDRMILRGKHYLWCIGPTNDGLPQRASF